MTVQLTSAGFERLGFKISRVANFLGGDGIKSVLNETGDDLVREFKKNIETFVPGEVVDLADSTKKQKLKKVGFMYPILRRSGKFIDSMRVRVTKKSNQWGLELFFVGANGKTLNSIIGDAHLNGTGRMPKRDFTKISNEWKDRVWERIRSRLWK